MQDSIPVSPYPTGATTDITTPDVATTDIATITESKIIAPC